MIRYLSFILLFLSVVSPRVSGAEEAFTYYSVVMLQTEKVFEERLGSVDTLSVYVKGIVDAAEAAIKPLPKGPPTKGFIVIAVKPGDRSRVWLDIKDPISKEAATALESAAAKVVPVSVKGGTLLFAIKVGLWGGESPSEMIPRPEAWRAEAEKAGRFIEYSELVDRVWQD
jgi:hypothetical protein